MGTLQKGGSWHSLLGASRGVWGKEKGAAEREAAAARIVAIGAFLGAETAPLPLFPLVCQFIRLPGATLGSVTRGPFSHDLKKAFSTPFWGGCRVQSLVGRHPVSLGPTQPACHGAGAAISGGV